ncbi:hypothetical protein SARC_07488 [Sphaeroforma arctica JP610]|uniref:Methyltransferase domain-containing protein n=1 Tax=Sphaeroforma arctica JP610 TaxID=667725 RepID=A0A0L0FU18_9EUKA|nr:hypothetical protein SARC_07488 [Sphaeroforma arctica JP610]KNC80149.1 hypothetical protein SARC_07488 [Sphaeroforma arctica JP610]|eukprot:XP_014154051.1 hypothetical protein SARC_07488 [Sphaeroforma arctica JP610]
MGRASNMSGDYVGVNKADVLDRMSQPQQAIDMDSKLKDLADKTKQIMKNLEGQTTPQTPSIDEKLAAMTTPDQWLHTPEEFKALDPQSQLFSLLKLTRTPTYDCKDREVLGGIEGGDGQWNTCFDSWTDTCKVFSFGIDYDFSWDQEVAARGKCKVASFDPSMEWEEKDVDANVRYYPVGIAANDDESIDGVRMRDGVQQKWKVATLGTSMKNLQVERLTVLKMDVEGFEWEAIPEMISSGALKHVDQFIFEVHYFQHLYQGQESVEHWYNTVRAMSDQGLEMFYSHLNPMSSYGTINGVDRVACCYEVSFVRPQSLSNR